MLLCHSHVDKNLLEPPKQQSMKLATLSSAKVKYIYSYTPTSLCIFMSYRLIKHKDIFTFALLSLSKLVEVFCNVQV
jgi:hypothetical protein